MPSCNNATLGSSPSPARPTVICLAVLLLTLLLTSPAVAQSNDAAAAKPAQPSDAAPANPTQPAHPVRRRPTLDDRVKAFASALNLNDVQQAAVKTILEQRQLETLRIRRDTSISGSDRIGRLRALQDQTVHRIRAVLNDEQKKKYDPLAVRRLTPAPDQKSIEDWQKATNPH